MLELPAATISEVAGPQEERLDDAARLLVARRGESLRIESVSDPSDPVQQLWDAGALLPGPGATLAGPTYAAWLRSTDFTG